MLTPGCRSRAFPAASVPLVSAQRFLRTRTEVAIAMPQFFLRQEMRERRQHDDGANHVDEESEYQQHAHVALELQPREDPQCDTDRQSDAGDRKSTRLNSSH